VLLVLVEDPLPISSDTPDPECYYRIVLLNIFPILLAFCPTGFSSAGEGQVVGMSQSKRPVEGIVFLLRVLVPDGELRLVVHTSPTSLPPFSYLTNSL
jgi:hypothetical protein